MKVGILTLPYEPNYGWAIQLWALYHCVEQLGHNPIVVDRRWNVTQKGIVFNIKRFIYYHLICGRFSRFIDKEIHHKTHEIRTSQAMSEVTDNIDAIVVGSDQVWRIENTRGVELNFFLDFIKNNSIRRISYAASFGKDTWQGSEDETIRIKELLSRFDVISVREQSGISLCEDLFGVNAVNVVDPTLLLDAEEYNRILSRPKKKKQLTTYILDSTIEKTETIKQMAENQKVQVVSLYPKNRVTYYHSVYYWLENIRDAEYVLVDSFHGMVFSIVFHKNFVVMANSKRGLTRFTSLLSQLGLEDRLTKDFSYNSVISIFSNKIDYKQVEEKLHKLRDFSMNILKDSLS